MCCNLDFSPYRIFDEINKIFRHKQQDYASRFILSSCEQWLSAEMCGLINDKCHEKTKGRFFCYNEDDKRDITFYLCNENDTPSIKGHAEVKVIYPLSPSKRASSINNLITKVSTCHQVNSSVNGSHDRPEHSRYPVEGWVFLIWTSYYNASYSAEDFFSIVEREIRQAYANACEKDQLRPFPLPQMRDFCDSEIKWRGGDVKIKVKAIPFTFSH